MQYSSLVLALSTLASASVLPRQSSTPVTETIAISNLYISSTQVSGDATYSFDAYTANGGQQGTCSTSNSVLGDDGHCPSTPAIIGTLGPANCSVDYFTWSLAEANAPTNPPTKGLSLQFNHTLPDGTLLMGCEFIQADFECYTDSSDPMQDSETYEGARSFNVTASSATTECIYA